jgi:hypothetical protein
VQKRDFTKVELRQLRALAATAYERELNAALTDLATDVDAWRSKRINAFDLADCVHEFHDGMARDLWKLYNGLRPPLLVAGALERGVLTEADIPAKLRSKLLARAV